MTRPIDLPGLPEVPANVEKGMRDLLVAMRTHLAVRNNPRAQHPDRSVTARELAQALAKIGQATSPSVSVSVGARPAAEPTTARLLELLSEAITAAQLDPDLAERLGLDVEDLPALTQQVVDLQTGLDDLTASVASLQALLTGITAFAWTLLDDVDAAAMRLTLGFDSAGQLRFYPDAVPASPTAWDDEFVGSTLNAKWTRNGDDGDHQTTGSGYFATTSYDTDTTWPSCYQARIVQSGTQKGWSLVEDFAPGSGAFSVTAKFFGQFRGNYGGANLYIMDSTRANGVRGGFGFNSGIAALPNLYGTLSTKASGTWTYDRSTAVMRGSGAQYIHLQRDASNGWTLFVSDNGWSWVKVGSYTLTVTVAKLILCGCLDGEAVDRHLGIDWVRVNALTLP